MIDLHTHLLPGVDDGARTAERAVQVLREFAAEGVTRVVCTPHLRASRAHEPPVERHARALARLREALGDAPAPDVAIGYEILLDDPAASLADPRLGLAGGPARLVEFPRVGVPARGAETLARLRADGLLPVVAHAERYWGATPELVRGWRAAGAVIQTDAAELVASGPAARLARLLLAEGLVDCLASDNHGDARSLAAARRWLEAAGASDEQLALLTSENAARALAGEPALPVPPLAIPRGVLARLRDLLLGRSA